MDATQTAMLNEDWLRTVRWDVRDASGQVVTTLDALAKVLGTERAEAAQQLSELPAASAAPQELVDEAQAELAAPADGQESLLDWDVDDGEPEVPEIAAEVKAVPAFLKGKKEEGADTGSSTRKATIAAGAFVSGNFGKGKVEVVVTSGKVPGVDTDVTGSKDTPACRVRVYEESNGKWSATDKRVAVKTSGLKTIPPLGAAKFGKKDATAGLVLLVAGLDPAQDVIAADEVRTVFERGSRSWPGEAKTALTREQWALGRAQAFVRKSRGAEIDGYVGDDDLLP